MAKIYTKNTWTDEVLGGDEKYQVKNDAGAEVYAEATITLSTDVVTAGTPVTADKMNNIENGIDTIGDAVNTPDLTEKTTPVAADIFRFWDSVALAFKKISFTNLIASLKATAPEIVTGTSDSTFLTPLSTKNSGIGVTYPCQGRLTLESGVPISTSDQAGKTTLYFTPFRGDKIALHDGTNWVLYSFSEISLDISAYTASKPYDIFAYNNSGTVAIEGLVWTNGTTRATALTTQNGVYVKTGNTTRRYIGTIYMDAASKCQDSATKRFVWNYYNRAPRYLGYAHFSGAGHTYTTGTWRSWNNDTALRFEFIVGVQESKFDYRVWGRFSGTGAADISFADNATNTSTPSMNLHTVAAGDHSLSFSISMVPGYHYWQITEYGSASSLTYVYAAVETFGDF